MSLEAIIRSLNPVIRGWGNYIVEGHVAELSYINRWMPTATLHDKLGLVSLVALRRRHLSPANGLGRG